MITYLGPEASFCEAAARSMLVDPGRGAAAELVRADPRLLAAASVEAALGAVRSGAAELAMVPLENSVEGAVTRTLDELADVSAPALQIVAEVALAVSFALLGEPGRELSTLRQVATHPHAAAQCRRWIAASLPGVEVVAAASTAQAAALVAAGEIDAALASPLAAERYRLAVLADGIEDTAGAVTRFVLVSRPTPPPPPTGADRTSVVAYIADDHPGALLELLTEFAVRGVNLTRIESRPTGAGLGRYCFSLDCEGHLEDARVAEALAGLARSCPRVRFLGSYPRADQVPTTVRPGTAAGDFTAAAHWLAGLRTGRHEDAAPPVTG